MNRKRTLITLTTGTLIFIFSSACNSLNHTESSRKSVVQLAHAEALRNDFDCEKYKVNDVDYHPDASAWVVFYEERGYGRTMGDHFAVIVDDRSGKTEYWEDAYYNVGVDNAIDARLRDIVEAKKTGLEP